MIGPVAVVEVPSSWIVLTCHRGDHHLVRFQGDRKAVVKCAWDGKDYKYDLAQDGYWYGCSPTSPKHPNTPAKVFGPDLWNWTIFNSGKDQQARLDEAYLTWKAHINNLVLAP